MKPTIEQIDAAITEEKTWNDCLNIVGKEHQETILFALRFTKKMMGEPTSRMVDLGNYCEFPIVSDIFKAMRDQAIKEVDNEN